MKYRFNQYGLQDENGEFYEGCQVIAVLEGSYIEIYGGVKVNNEGIPYVSSNQGNFIFQSLDDLMADE